jgi:hypothetical protein
MFCNLQRNGLKWGEKLDMFQDEDTAKALLAESTWLDSEARCLHCGTGSVQTHVKRGTMTLRYRQCEGRFMFSLRIDRVMVHSKLEYRAWPVITSLLAVKLKGISPLEVRRALGIGQEAPWLMLGLPTIAYEVEKDGCLDLPGATDSPRARSEATCQTVSARKGGAPGPQETTGLKSTLIQ